MVEQDRKVYQDRLNSANVYNIAEMERCYQYLADNPDLDKQRADRLWLRIKNYIQLVEPRLMESRARAMVGWYCHIRERFQDPTTTWKIYKPEACFM